MIKFNCFLNWSLLVFTYAYIMLFLIPIIYYYIIANDWNVVIPNLGNDLIKRILMLTHIFSGILCMIIYPLQRLLDQSSHFRHYFLGVLLMIFSLITSIMGNLYIFLYDTAGGLFMSVSFSVGGMIFMILSISVGISGYLYRENLFKVSEMNYIQDYNWDDSRKKRAKWIHLLVINLFGALVYASMFYRQLYLNAYIFGYTSQHPVTTMDYERPLDRVFQIVYYILPMLLMIIYTFVNKTFKQILKVILAIYMVYIFIVTVILMIK